jgi:hypothetical protein
MHIQLEEAVSSQAFLAASIASDALRSDAIGQVARNQAKLS